MTRPRLVIKVGTSTITAADGLDGKVLMRLAMTVSDLIERGWSVVIVTSGAVGAGRARLRIPHRPRSLPEKQAAAAVGQGLLMHAYEAVLAPLGLASAQILLTRADLADRQRYLNASNTLQTLLDFDPPVVPVINENDSVAVDELKFGDNDTLSALVAQLIEARWLVLFSDVAGLYDRNPNQHPDAHLLLEVPEITPEIETLAGGSGSDVGTGGMVTKLAAAKIATASGIPMLLMSGREPERLLDLLEGRPTVGTRFLPRADRMESRKRWLAYGVAPKGSLHLDPGAVQALSSGGKSLLPAGISRSEGDFTAGDTVRLLTPEGRELARGITNYAADEIRRITGRKSSEIESLLGYKPADEVIHRDNLALL
jgi:glutamate 5-kinase